ncbi:hypothetical protein T01_15192, partial [Trichinella spiralis]
MIPFKDSNGGVYVPAGRDDALSLVSGVNRIGYTEAQFIYIDLIRIICNAINSNLEITYFCIGESTE